MKTPLRSIAVVGIAASSLVAATVPAHAANLGNYVVRGTFMNKGDYLTRPFSGFSVQLIMQSDGNLVLKATNGHVCWAAGTQGRGYRAAYQSDGNFVVYDSNGKAWWASNTVGVNTGTTVAVGSEGALYVGYKKIHDCSWQ